MAQVNYMLLGILLVLSDFNSFCTCFTINKPNSDNNYLPFDLKMNNNNNNNKNSRKSDNFMSDNHIVFNLLVEDNKNHNQQQQHDHHNKKTINKREHHYNDNFPKITTPPQLLPTRGDEMRGECKLKPVEMRINLDGCGYFTINTTACAGLCKSDEQLIANTNLKKRSCSACRPTRYSMVKYNVKCSTSTPSAPKYKTYELIAISGCKCFKYSDTIVEIEASSSSSFSHQDQQQQLLANET